MRLCRIAAAAILAAIWLDAAPTRAEPAPSIVVHAPDDCAAALGLTARVRAALIGEPAADLQASVTIEQREGRHQAIVRTTRGSTEIGLKVVRAPTCEEAVDAAVVVLAMALAKQPRADDSAPPERTRELGEPMGRPVEPAGAPLEARSASAASPASPRSLVPAPTWGPAPWRPTADHRSPDRSSTARARHTRIAVLGGVDVGTVELATLYVGARVSREVGPVELRGTARYGLPRVEEETDAGVVDERRADFGAFDADVCYARGSAWQVALCGGAEVGVVRNTRRSGTEGSIEDTDAAEPRLAGIAAARLAYRAGMLQPELEVAGAAAALGPDDAPRLAIRTGLALAVQF